MSEQNILEVIEELGKLLKKYKDDIKYKDIEIEHLKNKIERIESYIAFYSEDSVTETDYKELKEVKEL